MSKEKPKFYDRPVLSHAQTSVIYQDPSYPTELGEILVNIGQHGQVDNDSLYRVSSEHGRTLNKDIRIVDPNCFVYTVHSYKGVMYDGIAAYYDPVVQSPSDALLAIWPRGLTEAYKPGELEAYVRNSEYLRGEGLITDWIVRISEVKEIEVNGEYLDPKILLRKFVQQRTNWIRTLPLFAAENVAHPEALDNVLNKFSSSMESARLPIVERALPVAERIVDLSLSQDPADLITLLKPAAKWWKMQDTSCLAHNPKPMPDIENRRGLKNYLTDWLPDSMGKYLAQIRKRGCRYEYPHNQNWMTIGALADCDTLRGFPVDGYIPTEEDFRNDVRLSVDALRILSESRAVINVAENPLPEMLDAFESAYEENL